MQLSYRGDGASTVARDSHCGFWSAKYEQMALDLSLLPAESRALS